MAELLAGPLGEGIRKGLRGAGLRKKRPTLADVEARLLRSEARVFTLAPEDATRKVVGRHRRPKYAWTHRAPRGRRTEARPGPGRAGPVVPVPGAGRRVLVVGPQ